MAEQMTEGQILDAFVRLSPGLSPDSAKQEQQPQAAPQQTQATGQPAPAETQASEQQPASEPEPQAAAEDQQDTQTIEIDPEEALFEQEIDEGGKKVTQKLSLKELQQGYLRQADYTRKTQELAKQREELPKAVAKQSQELSESYGKRLSELESFVMKTAAAEFQNLDLNKLAVEDPVEWVRQSNRLNQFSQTLNAIRMEKKAADDQVAQEASKQKAERWKQSLDVLTREIPNFGADVAKRLAETAGKYGFDINEVSQWDDHRLIKMAYDLSTRDAVESKRPEIEKKVAVVTKAIKPGAKSSNRSALDEAKQKLRKSGRMEDAFPVFNNLVR